MGREVASLEWAGIRQERKWLVLSAQDGKFPGFFWEKSGFREMAFGNADLYPTHPIIKKLLYISPFLKTLPYTPTQAGKNFTQHRTLHIQSTYQETFLMLHATSQLSQIPSRLWRHSKEISNP